MDDFPLHVFSPFRVSPYRQRVRESVELDAQIKILPRGEALVFGDKKAPPVPLAHGFHRLLLVKGQAQQQGADILRAQGVFVGGAAGGQPHAHQAHLRSIPP